MKAYTNPIENNIKYHSKVSRFNEYYGKQSHDGIDDCQFTLIEQCETRTAERGKHFGNTGLKHFTLMG